MKQPTKKEQLQADYKEMFGKDADPSKTIKELEAAIERGPDTTEETSSITPVEPAPETFEPSVEEYTTEEEEPVEVKKSGKGVWVSDHKELVSVEGTRRTTKQKDKKGKIVGGLEYFGQKIKD